MNKKKKSYNTGEVKLRLISSLYHLNPVQTAFRSFRSTTMAKVSNLEFLYQLEFRTRVLWLVSRLLTAQLW